MAAVFKKDPNSVLDYTFDWSAYLTPIGDAISSVTWVLTSGITKVSQSNSTTTATAFVSGGVAGNVETLTCRIVTTGGRTDDRSISLKIIDR